jgi:ankyrin repeat protein
MVNDFRLQRPLGYEISNENLNRSPVHYWPGNNYFLKPEPLKYDDIDGATTQRELVRLLVNAGADTEIKRQDGQTPLATAISYSNDHIIEALVQDGASPLTSTSKGENIFHYLLASSKSLDKPSTQDADDTAKRRREDTLQNIWKLLLDNDLAFKPQLPELVSTLGDYLTSQDLVTMFLPLGKCNK